MGRSSSNNIYKKRGRKKEKKDLDVSKNTKNAIRKNKEGNKTVKTLEKKTPPYMLFSYIWMGKDLLTRHKSKR